MARTHKGHYYRQTAWTRANPGYHAHLDEALANGIPYMTYFSRCRYLEWDPAVAATKPVRKAENESIASRCRRANVPRRTYYSVREELEDLGVEYTVEDVIEIAQTRRRA